MSKFTKGAIALVLAVGLFFGQTVCIASARTITADASITTTTRDGIIIQNAADVLGKTPQEFIAELRALRGQGGLRTLIDSENMTMKEFIEALREKIQTYITEHSNGNTAIRQLYAQILTILRQRPTLAFFMVNKTLTALVARNRIPAASAE